jgi:hypothetical protein
MRRSKPSGRAYCITGAAQKRISDRDPCPDATADAERLAHPAHGAWSAEYHEAEDAHTKSARELWSAREALLQTQPTSLAGLCAFLDHIEGPLSTGEGGEASWDDDERALVYPTLAAAVRDLIGAAVQP